MTHAAHSKHLSLHQGSFVIASKFPLLACLGCEHLLPQPECRGVPTCERLAAFNSARGAESQFNELARKKTLEWKATRTNVGTLSTEDDAPVRGSRFEFGENLRLRSWKTEASFLWKGRARDETWPSASSPVVDSTNKRFLSLNAEAGFLENGRVLSDSAV